MSRMFEVRHSDSPGGDARVVIGRLLNLLHRELDANQPWELDLHIGHDELQVSFELLCCMLRDRGSQLSHPARELLTWLALELNTEGELWADLATPRRVKAGDKEPQG